MPQAAKHFSRSRCPPLREKTLGKPGLVAQFEAPQLPEPGNDGAHRKTITCVTDGRLSQLSKGQLAEATRQRHPRRHGSRHGDGIPAFLWHGIQALEAIWAPGRRRAARRSEERRVGKEGGSRGARER